MDVVDIKPSNLTEKKQDPPTFNFCVSREFSSDNSINKQLSTADELFSDGMILPLPIMHQSNILPHLPPNQIVGGRRRIRRNSTGDYRQHNIRSSTPNPTLTPTPTGVLRSKSTGSRNLSSSSSSSSYYFGTTSGGSSGGIRISPILNFPPPRNILGKGKGNKFFGFLHFFTKRNNNSKDTPTSRRK